MWKEVLPRAGFSGVDFYLDDYEGQASSTVIVATAVDIKPSRIPFLQNTAHEFSIVGLLVVKMISLYLTSLS